MSNKKLLIELLEFISDLNLALTSIESDFVIDVLRGVRERLQNIVFRETNTLSSLAYGYLKSLTADSRPGDDMKELLDTISEYAKPISPFPYYSRYIVIMCRFGDMKDTYTDGTSYTLEEAFDYASKESFRRGGKYIPVVKELR